MWKAFRSALALPLIVAAAAFALAPARPVSGTYRAYVAPPSVVYLPVVFGPAATPAPSNVLVNPGFEQGFSGWAVAGYPLIASFAHTGTYAVRLGGYSRSGDGVSQPFTIPSCARSAAIEYWFYPVAVANHWNWVDELKMELSDVSVFPWTVIAAANNYVPLPPVGGPWQVQQSTTGDLTPYRGHAAFVGIDGITGPTSLSVWYVDDVLVSFTC